MWANHKKIKMLIHYYGLTPFSKLTKKESVYNVKCDCKKCIIIIMIIQIIINKTFVKKIQFFFVYSIQKSSNRVKITQ